MNKHWSRNKLLQLMIVFLFAVPLAAAVAPARAVDEKTYQAAEKYLNQNLGDGSDKLKTLPPLISEDKDKEKTDKIDKEETGKELDRAKKEKEKPSALEKEVTDIVTLEGFEPVKQFGYDIFKKSAGSFFPTVNDVPVNADYVIGPGDTFDVTLWGVSEGIFKLKVNQNGEIVIPKVGVVNVAGLTFGQLKPYVESQLNKFYEGINVGITFDRLKEIRVYVVGEVEKPGSYSLNSLSTAYNALFNAGGPTKMGSLRKIKVIRSGSVIATLDLYKFLLRGDSSQDRQLQSGDTVFVPLIGETVSVVGNVNRPAIYELSGRPDMIDVFWLAGDINPASYLNRVQIERTVAHQKKIIFDSDVSFLEEKKRMGLLILDRDIIKISPIFSRVDNKIFLKGNVKYPGAYEYKPGMKLLDVLSKDSIKDLYYPRVEVVRVQKEDNLKTTIFSIGYEKLFIEDNPSYNIPLFPLDEIYVFASEKKEETMTLKGEIKRPGKYAILKGERISSLLERAGGYTDYAYLFGSVLLRKSVKEIQKENYTQLIQKLELDLLRKERELTSGMVAKEDIPGRQATYERSHEIINFLKTASLKGRVIISLSELDKLKNSADDIEVEDGDELFVPKVPKSVVLLGEVYTPSAVAYDAYLSVRDYLHKVGGTTTNADNGGIYVIKPDGSVASRRQGVDLMSMRLYPGSSILVPEKLEAITFWGVLKETTHWVYEAAISLAVLSNIIK